MTGNPIKLGLALLAVCALSAVGASAASANPQFHLEMEDTTLTSGQITPNVLTTDSGGLECEVVHYNGTQGPLTSTTLRLFPVYENCEMGGVAATVTVNGCSYLFHLLPNTETYEAAMDINCPATKLVIHVPFCTITVPPQNGLETVTFTNEGAGATRGLVIDITAGGIDYVEHGIFCPNETITTNNGTYFGQVTVKGENGAGEHKAIWVE